MKNKNQEEKEGIIISGFWEGSEKRDEVYVNEMLKGLDRARENTARFGTEHRVSPGTFKLFIEYAEMTKPKETLREEWVMSRVIIRDEPDQPSPIEDLEASFLKLKISSTFPDISADLVESLVDAAMIFSRASEESYLSVLDRISFTLAALENYRIEDPKKAVKALVRVLITKAANSEKVIMEDIKLLEPRVDTDPRKAYVETSDKVKSEFIRNKRDASRKKGRGW